MRKGLKSVYVLHRGQISTAIVRERAFRGSKSGITDFSKRAVYTTVVSEIDTNPKVWTNPKWFVGMFPSGNYEAFQSCDEFPYIDDRYLTCMGPLSKHACDWIVNGGYKVQEFKTVKDAERLSRICKINQVEGFDNLKVKTLIHPVK